MLRLIGKIGKPLLFLIGILLIAALTMLMISSIAGFIMGYPFFGYLLPNSPFIAGFGIANIFTVIAVPLLALIFFILRITTNNRVSKKIMSGAWVLWVVALLGGMFCVSYVFRDFNAGKEIKRDLSANFDTDTLVVNFTDNPYQDGILTIGPNKVFDEEMINSAISYSILKSNSGDFEIEQKNYSRGRNLREANTLAETIDIEPQISYNSITIPSFFSIKKGEKYRGQHTEFTIRVPEGKHIKIGDNPEEEHWHHLDRGRIDYNDEYKRPWMELGQTWKMTVGGLMLPSYQKNPNNLSYKNFNKLNITGNINVVIEKSNQFELGLVGSEKQKKYVEMEQVGERLNIDFDRYSHHGSNLRLYIKCPDLESLTLEDTDDVEISGFDFDDFELAATGRQEIKGDFTAKRLDVKLKNRTELILDGSADFMKVDLDDYTDLDAEEFKAIKAKIKGSHSRHDISLNVRDTFIYDLHHNAEYKLEGKPWTQNLDDVEEEEVLTENN